MTRNINSIIISNINYTVSISCKLLRRRQFRNHKGENNGGMNEQRN